MNNRHPILAHIDALGQQIWLDQLTREWLLDGTLRAWQAKGVTGVTTNPAIFEKAISQSDAYRDELATLRRSNLEPEAALELLVAADVLSACQQFRATWEANAGRAGYVSIEVSPALAHDRDGTIAAAKRLTARIPEPNVLIKIPATAAGIDAMATLVAEGIGVNVTLIFSPGQWQAVVDAYRRAAAAAQALGITPGYSVASVFLSRMDSAVDPLLAERAPEHPEWQGMTAVAMAKAIGATYRSLLATDPLFAAHPQRVLWASTSTKNPAYSDLLYVEPLIGPETINTLPLATLEALLDHGKADEATLALHVDEAHQHLQRLQTLGIDLEAIGADLQRAGLNAFAQAQARLLAIVAG